MSAYPETNRWSQPSSQAASMSSGRSSTAVPRSEAIERAPSGETSEQMSLLRPAIGPTTSTPVPEALPS